MSGSARIGESAAVRRVESSPGEVITRPERALRLDDPLNDPLQSSVRSANGRSIFAAPTLLHSPPHGNGMRMDTKRIVSPADYSSSYQTPTALIHLTIKSFSKAPQALFGVRVGDGLTRFRAAGLRVIRMQRVLAAFPVSDW